MSVAEIKAAIDQLTEEQRAELLCSLRPSPDDAWDLQMKADAAAGRLDWLHEEADEAIRNGDVRQFP